MSGMGILGVIYNIGVWVVAILILVAHALYLRELAR